MYAERIGNDIGMRERGKRWGKHVGFKKPRPTLLFPSKKIKVINILKLKAV